MLEINPTFRDLIPPLTAEEFAQLESNCLQDGIMHPIITWRGQIIDGHNRYQIVQTHGLDYQTEVMEFASEADAIVWIIQHQMGRRNLNAYNRSVLALKMEGVLKEKGLQVMAEKGKEGGRGNKKEKGLENSTNPFGYNTREELAKTANVSSNTIAKVKAIEAKATPEQKAKLAKGDTTINKVYTSLNKQDKLQEAKQKALEVSRADHKHAPTITQMDCVDFLHTFKDGEIDVLMTDPPYSTDIGDIQEFANRWVPVALQKLSKQGRGYIFTGAYPQEMQAYLNVLLSQTGFIVDAPIVWSYKNTLGVTPKMKYNLNYQVCWHVYTTESAPLDTSITNEMFSAKEINAPDGRLGNRFHAWQKPDELCEMLVRHSLQKDGLLVDCFACTGAFLIAGAKAGMVPKGCDISEENIQIALQRGCAHV